MCATYQLTTEGIFLSVCTCRLRLYTTRVTYRICSLLTSVRNVREDMSRKSLLWMDGPIILFMNCNGPDRTAPCPFNECD